MTRRTSRRWFMLLWLAGCTADHHAARGKNALDRHDLATAETGFRKALARDAEHVEALAGLGWTYLLAGQVDAARGAFDRCHSVSPTTIQCIRGQASVASASGNPALAHARLDQAIVLDPHDAGVLSSKALLALTGGDLVTAGAQYKALVGRFPNKAEYRLGMAEVRLRENAYTEALNILEAALALEGTPRRYLAMMRQTQARTLVAATAGRVDPERCAETAPQVRSWLDAADEAVSAAEETQVPLPDLTVVRRLIRRRRAMVDEVCPFQG